MGGGCRPISTQNSAAISLLRYDRSLRLAQDVEAYNSSILHVLHAIDIEFELQPVQPAYFKYFSSQGQQKMMEKV